jgi:hypothetical protein
VFAVKFLGVSEGHFAHFYVRDSETVLLDSCQDFPDVSVGVWLDHSEGSKVLSMGVMGGIYLLLFDLFEFTSGKDVRVVNYFELS